MMRKVANESFDIVEMWGGSVVCGGGPMVFHGGGDRVSIAGAHAVSNRAQAEQRGGSFEFIHTHVASDTRLGGMNSKA